MIAVGIRLIRSRRGVNPIIAHMIMLLLVVTAMGMVLVWTMQSIGSPEYRSALSERVVVENAWFDSSTTVKLYTRNTGKVDLRVIAIYVNDVLVVEPDLYFPTKYGIDVDITMTQSWQSGEDHTFLFITERGSRFEFTYRAP